MIPFNKPYLTGKEMYCVDLVVNNRKNISDGIKINSNSQQDIISYSTIIRKLVVFIKLEGFSLSR